MTTTYMEYNYISSIVKLNVELLPFVCVEFHIVILKPSLSPKCSFSKMSEVVCDKMFDEPGTFE